MKEIICPECSKSIPEYRLEDPYCDCGWEPLKKVDSFDFVGWLLTVIYVSLFCILQLLVVLVLHSLGSVALSFIANIMVEFVRADVVALMFYFLIILLDFIALSVFYFGFIYFMTKKSSRPILYSVSLGIIILVFKFFLIDPYSRMPLQFLVYIENLLLLGVAVGSGYFIAYRDKLVLNRFKPGCKVS